MSVRSRLPHLLVGAGVALLGLVVAIVILHERKPKSRPKPHAAPTTTVAAPPTAPTTTTAPPTTTTAAPPPPSVLTDVTVAATLPSGARISWRAPPGADVRLAYGPAGLPPTLWAAPPKDAGSITLGGLSVGGTYDVHVSAAGAEQTVSVHPTAPTTRVAASIGGGDVLLEGQPFFPLLVYGQCPGSVAGVLSIGINLFTNNACGGTLELAQALSGQALSLAQPAEGALDAPGVIGSNLPDEADGHGITGASLPDAPTVRFLTLTNHFYSGAAPLPTGRSMYPGLVAKADVIGFDLYPLQNWCRPERLADVYAAQRELVGLAGGKPTFQWIETGHMDCPETPELAVTPATMRAESWLAIAGGARGLGFFPIGWTGENGAAIAAVAQDVQALGPALLAQDAPVSVSTGPVRVGARRLGGALYVFAVNSSFAPASATISAPGLGNRPLQVLGEGRQVAPKDGSFADSFAPLAVHLYIAAPA